MASAALYSRVTQTKRQILTVYTPLGESLKVNNGIRTFKRCSHYSHRWSTLCTLRDVLQALWSMTSEILHQESPVIMARNSSWFTGDQVETCIMFGIITRHTLCYCEGLRKFDDSLSPSPSVSNSSIMLRSSSSLMFSPSSRATRLRFLRLILPDSSSSNSLKAFRISSFGSRSRIRSVTEQITSLGL